MLKAVATLVVVAVLAAAVPATEVVVVTIGAEIVRGTLISIDDAQLAVQDARGKERVIPLADCVKIRFGTRKLSLPSTASGLIRFELANGDVVHGAVVDSNFDEVRIETAAFGTLAISIDRIRRAVILANADGIPERMGADLPDDRDVLFIRSRQGVDHVVGEVDRFARDAIFFDWREGTVTRFAFAADKVVAVRLGQPEIDAAPEGIHAVVYSRDGSRLLGRVTKAVGASLRIEAAIDLTTAVHDSELVEISFRGGRFDFLSDIEPASVKEVPYIEGGLTWGLRRDEGLSGKPVRVGGVFHPKAISVHSLTEATWELDGRYSSFSCSIGIDDLVASRSQRGAVAFSVLVDGKLVKGPLVQRGGDAPSPMEAIDVSGAKRITLKANFADNYHFNGWAVWGDPVLVRKQ